MARRPKIQKLLNPIIDRAAFDAAFKAAHAKWPNVDLGYIGTDAKGNHYFQERGNVEAFVLEA